MALNELKAFWPNSLRPEMMRIDIFIDSREIQAEINFVHAHIFRDIRGAIDQKCYMIS